MEKLYAHNEEEEEEEEDMNDDDGNDDTFSKDGTTSIAVSSSTSRRLPVRADLDGMMDEFLDSYSMVGKHKKRIKRVGNQTGLEQLDDIVCLYFASSSLFPLSPLLPSFNAFINQLIHPSINSRNA